MSSKNDYAQLNEDITTLSNELVVVKGELHTVANRLDSGASKMNKIFWMGVIAIVLGVVKLLTELYNTGVFNG